MWKFCLVLGGAFPWKNVVLSWRLVLQPRRSEAEISDGLVKLLRANTIWESKNKSKEYNKYDG